MKVVKIEEANFSPIWGKMRLLLLNEANFFSDVGVKDNYICLYG